jgi:hypothetical protein
MEPEKPFARKTRSKKHAADNTGAVFSMWFMLRRLLGSSQRANGLAGQRSHGNPNRHARNNGRAVFSVHGPCREDIRVSIVQLESVIIDQNSGSQQSKELDCAKKT